MSKNDIMYGFSIVFGLIFIVTITMYVTRLVVKRQLVGCVPGRVISCFTENNEGHQDLGRKYCDEDGWWEGCHEF